MAEETVPGTKPKRGRPSGPKTASESDKIPVFMRGRIARSMAGIRVKCEAPDATNYEAYMAYSEEAMKGQGISRDELEARFNAAAWSAIWNKDAGFKAYLKKKQDEESSEQ